MDSTSSESPVCHVRASVMMYNQTEKRWYPCSGNGISRVYIYQNPANQSFRVVGRKNDTQEVSVHCSIVRGLIYNEATATFHQWRHSGSVYGLEIDQDKNIFKSIFEAQFLVTRRIAKFLTMDEQMSRFCVRKNSVALR